MSNDGLILDLSADLVSVRRRSALREAILLLAVAVAELALFLWLGMMRPDMGRMIGSGYMLWKLGSLAALAAMSCATAIRSFSPVVSPRTGSVLTLALAGAAIAAATFIDPGAASGSAILDRLSPARGLLCATSIVVLSMPIMAVLAMLMRRGAPAHPRASAFASGLAAASCGALVFAFCCPINDPLYIIVWYSAGCVVVVMAARWLLPRRFRL